MSPALSSAQGYGIVVGLGVSFSLAMMLITWMLKRYSHQVQTSEEFSTAGRTVKSGIIAAAVCSSWTWAATLLQSTSMAYRYGVSGPFWYASGATVQIILFASLAIELKRRAPFAHTYLEVIKARYGKKAHVVYMVFALFTNCLVSLMLLTGGSAVINNLTGIPVPAACFLIPLPVIAFTIFGGIKATFLSDYSHSLLVLVFIVVFALKTYATNEILGSPARVFDKLVELAISEPVAGNAGGSYLTMRSQEGAIFFVINLVGNFGTVFLDNGYWQKAIAASPAAALPGYILGGICWFAIPWLCATTMGLAALCLESNPVFPTFPLRLTAADVSAGLVLPNAAVALMGPTGAILTLILLFMAVTSALSSELVAVSSIFTYDVYRTYINTQASGKKLVFMSHLVVFIFGMIMAGFSTGLYYIGVSMGFLYLLMGVVISAAVLPAACTLLSRHQNAMAATYSPILGTVCSFIAWLVTTQKQYGTINVETSGSNNPMLAGNVVALLSPMVFIPLFTLIGGSQHYDFSSMKALKAVDDSEFLKEDSEVNIQHDVSATEAETKDLERKSFLAKVVASVLTICLLVLWPMPMYGTGYIFSEKFFTGWVVVGLLWTFFAIGATGIFPLYEGRAGLARVFRGIWADISGQAWKNKVHHGVVVEERASVSGDEKAAEALPSKNVPVDETQ